MIKFESVGKIYPNGFPGLTDVNLEIQDGEFVGIIGTSGAGKSTLVRTINGLNNVTSGKLIVNGTDVAKLRGKELRRFRRKVGMIFQSYNLVPRISVLRNVLTAFVPDMSFGKVLFGLFSKEDKIKALEALDRVGILDKAYTRADQLSGGQQQRVSLARALAQDSDILLADEPVSALDPVTAKEVMDDFKRINEDLNKTVLINIHHVELALQYASRIVAIKKGRIVYDGPSSEVTQEILDEVYRKETEEVGSEK